MTHDDERAHKDLAFLRALVSEGSKSQSAGGLVFLTAGLAYGLDCLAYWAQMDFHLPTTPAIGLALIFVPITIVVPVIIYVIWQGRKDGPQGVATRALNAAYSSLGLANVFIALGFGYVANTQHNMLIWLLYPVVICAFLGAVWYVAYMIRRKLWLAAVSAGWFVTTLALGLLIRQTQSYMLVLGIALIVLMGGGGWVMMHLNKRHQAIHKETGA